MTRPAQVLQIAVPSPLYTSFDYLPPPGIDPGDIAPGVRVRVPFGRRDLTGVVLAARPSARIEGRRLRTITAVLDDEPLLPPTLLRLLEWAAEYYHYPIGETIATALPALLRRGRPWSSLTRSVWRATALARRLDRDGLARAPRQAALLALLRENPQGLSPEALAREVPGASRVCRALAEKGLVERVDHPGSDDEPMAKPASSLELNPAQSAAVEAIAASPGFVAFLLDGVTGSGKTEVYMALIDATLKRDRQALVLVPEIGLTPQLMQRFRRRFPARTIAMLHSGLADGERAQAWRSAAIGDAPIVIGTRSAVFVPLARPGLIIVDEEHDLSYKQQEGFRYHARDLAVVRARDERIPVVLGSATPSLESLHNASRGHYRHLHLPERAGRARAPRIGLLDLRHQPLDEGLSPTLIQRVSEHLDASSQVLLFVNRRGYAPTLLCHECGWVARCRRCDAHLTVHARDARLRCHHCGAERPVDPQCPECGSAELLALGLGTQRLEQTLADRFPGTGIVRIDRDTTRRRGAMAERLTEVRAGTHRILVGTQMLAKGHHFPDVTLAAIIDIDQGLFSADFRAPERMAQLVVQVAGRAGRAERPGEVLIQTHHPEHPLLRTLIENGYRVFAEAALEERRAAGLPPFTSLALLRAEAPRPEAPARFLEAARRPLAAAGADEVELLGPVPAPMELRGGRYRAQLLLRAERRAPLQRVLHRAVPRLAELPEARRVRWSLDVDPMEMF